MPELWSQVQARMERPVLKIWAPYKGIPHGSGPVERWHEIWIQNPRSDAYRHQDPYVLDVEANISPPN
jgi:hypothetical protein